MAAFFFYGTLRHLPLLRVVLGREAAVTPARLAGHAVHWVRDSSFPMIVAAPGETAEGVVLENLTEFDIARLDFYEGGFAYDARVLTVETAGGPLAAHVYVPVTPHWQSDGQWDLADWTLRWGDVVVAAGQDFMDLFGVVPAHDVLPRYNAMLVRAASRLRAMGGVPAQVRRRNASGDVALHAVHHPYARFFALEEYDLQFRRFDGRLSPVVNRAAFISGDAAIVLPYDPHRDRVLLIEQFRIGPFARGDDQPWMLEAIAGRVDGDETPETAARREAEEEAGLVIHELIPAPACYPSPGAKSEYHYHFIGIADLPDTAAGLGGLAAEAEDIRSHVLTFDDLMALVESGEADNSPLVLLALWLAARRDGLRTAAGA